MFDTIISIICIILIILILYDIYDYLQNKRSDKQSDKFELYTNVILPNKYINNIYPRNPDNKIICDYIKKSLMCGVFSKKLSAPTTNKFWDDHLQNLCK